MENIIEFVYSRSDFTYAEVRDLLTAKSVNNNISDIAHSEGICVQDVEQFFAIVETFNG